MVLKIPKWIAPLLLIGLAFGVAGTVMAGSAQATANTVTVHVKQSTLADHSKDCKEGETSAAHFVITQIGDARPDSIEVTVDGLGTVTVPLLKLTGDTAHYEVATHGGLVTDATAKVPYDWTGQFNLSHYVCGGDESSTTTTSSSTTTTPSETSSTTTTPSETTSTTSSTTTTTSSTTTTPPETTTSTTTPPETTTTTVTSPPVTTSTTTTSPPETTSSTTSSTSSSSTSSTSSTAPPSTTSTDATSPETSTSTPPEETPPNELAFTGSSISKLTLIAMLAVIAGGVCMIGYLILRSRKGAHS